jgi:hypothetical protein
MKKLVALSGSSPWRLSVCHPTRYSPHALRNRYRFLGVVKGLAARTRRHDRVISVVEQGSEQEADWNGDGGVAVNHAIDLALGEAKVSGCGGVGEFQDFEGFDQFLRFQVAEELPVHQRQSFGRN